MPETVKIGGNEQTLPDFSAFKALHAAEIVGEIEETIRELVHQAGDFRREYAERHVIRMTRAEARRQYPPEPLFRRIAIEGGVEVVPALDEEGGVIIGPDPLGHLTDADWSASDQVLTIPEYPDEDAVVMAMAGSAFKLAKDSVLRLLALALAQNRDLEKWDEESTVDAELVAAGKALTHAATAAELAELVVAVIGLTKEQLAGPVGKAWAEARDLWTPSATAVELEATPPPQGPMRIETDGSQESSTPSPDGTDGTPEPSSTEPAGASL